MSRLVFVKDNQKRLNWCIHVSRRSEQGPQCSNSQFSAIRTLRRMFTCIEFPRALGRSEAVVTRMLSSLRLTYFSFPQEMQSSSKD